MQRNLKKLWPAAAASLVAFTSLVNAQVDNAQMRNMENRISALEQRRGASGMINPPGRPQVKGGADLFIFGDLLYWNAHENGLSYAIENDSGGDANLSNAQIKNVHGKWNWGFRVGAGYNLPHDGWDVNLTWLRFTDNSRKRTHAHDAEVIFPVLTHPGDPVARGAAASKGHSRWNLNLNQLDLDLGREFFVSKWLTMRPHFGLRTNWIRQKLENDYQNFISLTPLPNEVAVELKDRWWGLGLEGGLDTQWGLGSGISIFADLSAAIVYGLHDFKIDEDVDPSSVTAPDGTFVGINDSSYRISHPELDLVMGLRYDYMFSDDRFHIGLQLGWEHHVYFSQNQFPVFVDDTSLGSFVRNQGDLTLQGWTFAARFDF